MKSFIKLFALSVFVLAFIAPTLIPSKVSATLAGFAPSNIMSDYVMGNKNTMNAVEIQNFLNAKVPTCTTNQIRGYTNESRAIAPCLKNYTENGQTAAQIIWQASQDYSINPQVLLVLLEKEQGLVTDTWPRDGWWWTKTNLGKPVMECTYVDPNDGQTKPKYCVNVQYRSATGYGCPDTAPCAEQYFGFTNQIRKAAALFREVLNGGWSNYPVGVNYIQYSPNAGCGGSNVNIQNRATSALYRYTPYQPNAAALAAGWGTVNCGAYGNRNFYNYFTDWFGSTQGELVSTVNSGVYKIESGQKRAFPDGITFLSYSYRWSDIAVISASQMAQIPTGAPLAYNVNFRNGKYVRVSDGVYLVENGVKRGVPDAITLQSHGYTFANVVAISSVEMAKIPNGPEVPYYVNYRNGKLVSSDGNAIYLVEYGLKRAIPDGATFASYSFKWSDIINVSTLEITKIPNGTVLPRK